MAKLRGSVRNKRNRSMDLIMERAYFALHDHEQQSWFRQDHPRVDKHVSKVQLFQDCNSTRHHTFFGFWTIAAFFWVNFIAVRRFRTLFILWVSVWVFWRICWWTLAGRQVVFTHASKPPEKCQKTGDRCHECPRAMADKTKICSFPLLVIIRQFFNSWPITAAFRTKGRLDRPRLI